MNAMTTTQPGKDRNGSLHPKRLNGRCRHTGPESTEAPRWYLGTIV